MPKASQEFWKRPYWKARNEQISLYPTPQAALEWKAFFNQEDNYYELLVAFWASALPYLVKINPAECVPIKQNEHFAVSGIGADLASFVLADLTEPDMQSDLASVVLVHAIDTVCKHVNYCQGPTRLAITRPTTEDADGLLAEALISPVGRVQEISQMVADVEAQTKEARKTGLMQGLGKMAAEAAKRLFKDF